MGLSRDEETFSIITEYLDRGSLDDILHNAAIVIEPEHVRLFALDAAKGMTYLHAAGVLHRDLKCGNLLVDKDWNVKVAVPYLPLPMPLPFHHSSPPPRPSLPLPLLLPVLLILTLTLGLWSLSR